MARKPLSPRRRADILFVLFLCGYALVAVRLFQIQILGRARYQALADHFRDIRLPAHRGLILDRNGEQLAINADAGSISLDPSFYWDPDKWRYTRKDGKRVREAPDKDKAAREIADILGMDYAEIRPKLDKKTKFVWIKRHVPLDNVRRADAANIPGLQIDDELKRVYPMGSLAAQVLGYTGVDGQGLSGLEMRYESALARNDGVEVIEVDRLGRPIPGTLRNVREPVDGGAVTLTIDARIQQVAERELAKTCTTYRAAGGTCTVIDPTTGEILALANYPAFDPNNPGAYSADAWRDRAVTDLYEPGSTMKGVTAAAALNEHVVNLTERFSCPGFLHIGGRTVHDVYEGPGSFGMLNLPGILRYSSNVGMSQVGLRLGATRLHHYVEGFGLLDRSGVELPGEPPSWMPPAERWDKHFTATVAFGQSVNFTPLRLATAYAAIANGGVLIKPHIIKRIEWPQQGAKPPRVETFGATPLRRVVSEEAAHTVTQMLQGVVDEGTGKPAKIRGYEVVGKTGSAQKAIPGKGYVAGKFIASFIGYLPAKHPRAVILVTVDEPKGTHWGAVAAGPVFREVARQVMWYLEVPPDNPNDRVDGSEPRTWRRRAG